MHIYIYIYIYCCGTGSAGWSTVEVHGVVEESGASELTAQSSVEAAR